MQEEVEDFLEVSGNIGADEENRWGRGPISKHIHV
jgi:hypothetical protein